MVWQVASWPMPKLYPCAASALCRRHCCSTLLTRSRPWTSCASWWRARSRRARPGWWIWRWWSMCSRCDADWRLHIQSPHAAAVRRSNETEAVSNAAQSYILHVDSCCLRYAQITFCSKTSSFTIVFAKEASFVGHSFRMSIVCSRHVPMHG